MIITECTSGQFIHLNNIFVFNYTIILLCYINAIFETQNYINKKNQFKCIMLTINKQPVGTFI